MILVKVKSGLYSNASEVIRDSIRNLEKEEQKQKSWDSLNNLLSEAANSGRSESSIDDIVNAINSDIDAFYLASGFFLNENDIAKISSKLIDEKIPSFTNTL